MVRRRAQRAGPRRVIALALAVALFISALPPVADAQTPTPVPSSCPQFSLPHGALAMACVPPEWNGDLVIWAHALTGNWLQHKKHTGKQ